MNVYSVTSWLLWAYAISIKGIVFCTYPEQAVVDHTSRCPHEPLGFTEECSIRLIYLGNQRFGILTWRPRSKSPGFNIVEEYTLDEDIDSRKQVNMNKVSPDAAGNVATSGGDGKVESVQQAVNNYPVKETVELKLEARESSNAKSLQVVTEVLSAPTTETEQSIPTMPPTRPVTCPKDSIVLSHYPWKSKLEVHLERVLELELDIWCNRVGDYYKYMPAPEVTPVISDVKGYGLHKCSVKEETPLED